MPRQRAPLWLLVFVTVSGTAAMHMFVPALPQAAQHFAVDRAAMQAAVTLYIFGMAIGQLVYGPLSDAFGRRPMLLLGLALYTVSSAAAAFAASVKMLVTARLFQALGGCAGHALGRAIVRDTSTPESTMRDLALLNLMSMMGPGLAPLIGAFITAAAGWRGIFVFLGTMGGIALFCAWRMLPESARSARNLRPRVLAREYAALFRSRAFLGYTLGGGVSTTSFFAFVTAAPFILGSQFGRPSQEVGMHLATLIVGMFLGNAFTRRFAGRIRNDRLMIGGNALSVACALIMLVAAATHALNAYVATALMFFYTLGAGITSPAALTKALSINPNVVGLAAGLYGFTQMTIGALCTWLVGFGEDPALSAAAVLVVAALSGQLSFWIGVRAEREGRR